MSERASHVATLCSARRRRERQLRSMWRHEQLSNKMAVSCAVHHSAQRSRFDAADQTQWTSSTCLMMTLTSLRTLRQLQWSNTLLLLLPYMQHLHPASRASNNSWTLPCHRSRNIMPMWPVFREVRLSARSIAPVPAAHAAPAPAVESVAPAPVPEFVTIACTMDCTDSMNHHVCASSCGNSSFRQ